MKQIIGKSCKITISCKGKDLFYTVKEVIEVTPTHITFIDKFNQQYSYRLLDVVEIQGVK